VPGEATDSVFAAVERDLAELPERPGTAALRAMARTAARMIDAEGPPAPRVAALKTLESVLAQLRGVPRGVADGDGVDRIKRGASRRRGTAA
jgi:hypothetical protein